MKRIYVLVVVAIIGVTIALYAVIDSNRVAPANISAMPAQRVPFASYVAGSGITESAGGGNVSVATSVSGVVREVDVRVGDQVKLGDPLFRIDDRDLRSRLVVAQANVRQVLAALAIPRHRLEFLSHLRQRDKSATSVESLDAARDAVAAAEAALALAKANAAQIESDIERLLVRSPATGRVLQVNIRVGEFAATGASGKPLMLLGDENRMYLRLNIDETDADRVRTDASAVAYVRGDPRVAIPLRFEYIEPYVIPKTSLTGRTTERTDLRVLQVIYSFERDALPVYLGQQMDAFIQTAPARQDTATEAH